MYMFVLYWRDVVVSEQEEEREGAMYSGDWQVAGRRETSTWTRARCYGSAQDWEGRLVPAEWVVL